MILDKNGPTEQEKRDLVARAVRCWSCNVGECLEQTPNGVRPCSSMMYWHGKPLVKQVIRAWRGEILEKQRYAQY